MTLTVNGKTVSYLDSAPNQSNGKIILFLHGWGAPVATYQPLLDFLSGFGRVIAPDLPGFGGSDEPNEPWCVDDYVRFTTDFATALDVREAILVNHSFGGRISIKLLSQEKPALTVKKAVFIDAAGIKPRHGIQYYAKVYSYKLSKKVMSIPPMQKLFPNAVEKARSRSGSADYRNASPMMRQTMVRCINEDLTDYLPQIRASVLLIWGENDTATPLRDGKIMEKSIPDAGLVTLQGAGHFSYIEQWGICQRVLASFLE